MMVEKILFYCFSVVLVVSSVVVVTHRNPVHSALFLVLAFFTSAAIWMLLEAEFLAITLVLVYVGAVMVLFLFVVMMIDIDMAALRASFIKSLPIGLIIAFIMAVETVSVFIIKGGVLRNAPNAHASFERYSQYSNTSELGDLLYTHYVYPFEISAVILLVAIVAAIVLTMRRRSGTKYQDPSKQVLVNSVDRLKIIKMESDQRPLGGNE